MMDMILECKVSEDSYDENRMDILFGELEQRDPHHPAVLQYRSFKLGSAKTLSSIMVTAVSNLHMLQSAAFAEMIASDEMFLPQLGVEKRAIFCVIPDNDDTFNFMVSIGYALVVLFFAISLCKNTMNFHELKRPEAAIHYFLRFVAAKTLVGYGMDIMLNVFSICNGIVTDMADSMGGISEAMVSLPAEMQTAIENVGFLASIPLWLVTILGSLFITVLSFVMILTVYGRFFRLYMYTALAPLPLAAFAGESTQSVGISFLKSYVGVCLEGAVIVLACVIYSAFVSTPTVASGEATTIVWSYLAETVFNMLVLVGLIKGSDRTIHEMMGL